MLYFSMTDGIVTAEDHNDNIVATIDISDGGSQGALDALWVLVDEHGADRWMNSSSMSGEHLDAWEHLLSFLRSEVA